MLISQQGPQALSSQIDSICLLEVYVQGSQIRGICREKGVVPVSPVKGSNSNVAGIGLGISYGNLGMKKVLDVKQA